MNSSIGQFVLAVGRVNPNGIGLLGSAFAVAAQHFATAAHVLQQDDRGLSLILNRSNSFHDYQDTTDTFLQGFSVEIAELDPIRDIAILKIKGGYVTIPYSVGTSDHAIPGTSIISVGFPHAGDGRLVLTQQGSTVGARVLLGAGPIKTKHLIMNVQTRPGQSGSPVFISGRNEVCAMIIGGYAAKGSNGMISLGGIDPYTLHQTTHAISAEYIREML